MPSTMGEMGELLYLRFKYIYGKDLISSNDMLSIHDGATAFDALIVKYTDRLMCIICTGTKAHKYTHVHC